METPATDVPITIETDTDEGSEKSDDHPDSPGDNTVVPQPMNIPVINPFLSPNTGDKAEAKTRFTGVLSQKEEKKKTYND